MIFMFIPNKIMKRSSARKSHRKSYRSRKLWENRIRAQQRKSHELARKKYGTPKCGPGQIVRDGYVRKAYSKKGKRISKTIVKPVCIKDLGKPGKGPALIGPMKHGTLGKYGYVDIVHKSADTRHKALKKAVSAYGWLSVFRKLNAVAVLTKTTNPRLSRTFHADRDWVKRNYWHNTKSKKKSK